MTSVSQLCQTFQTVLTTVADHTAQATRFVQRQSKLTGAKFVQTLVFGWWDDPKATYEQLAQTATGLGVPITAQGLDARFTPEAAECVKQTLEAAVQQVVTADPVAIPLLQRFNGVFLQDSTTITLPDALVELWRGCGGSLTEGTVAALKVQAQVNMRDGQFTHLDLQAGRAQDKTAPMQTAPLPPGALRIADLGYLSIPVLRAYGEQGVYWLTRYQASVLLCTPDGQPFNLATFLQAYPHNVLDQAVLFSDQHRLPCRLIAVRVPSQVAAERRRKLNAEARREGRTPSAKQLALCDWVILVTNVLVEQLSVEEALVLARLRWQIELVFKLWKSYGGVDESRSAKPYRILCEVYAKLLVMLMHHWVAITCGWQHPNRSWLKTAQTIRQHVISLASALSSKEQLTKVFNTIQVCLAKGARLNTRKTKPNAYQLLLACGEEVLA
jgi:Transposase DDE domain